MAIRGKKSSYGNTGNILDPIGKALDTAGAMNPFKKPGIPDVAEVNDVASQNRITAPEFQGSTPSTVHPVTMDRRSDDFRAYQQNLAAQLAQQASGQGPSIAQMQAKKAQDQALAQNMAMLASQRGGPTALAAKQAATQNAGIQRGIANDSAIARLQEQQMAVQNLAGVAQGARGQDMEIASQEANMRLDADKFNQQQAMQFNQLKAQYAQMGLSAQQAQQQAALDVEKMRQQREANIAGFSQAASQEQRKVVGGLVNQAGAAAATYATGKPPV